MDNGLAKYNIDGTNCFQRMVCEKVKKATTHTDDKLNALITAVTHSEWAMKFVSGTAVEYAIDMAKTERDCNEVFNQCTLTWPLAHEDL